MDNQSEITDIIDPVWTERKASIQKLTSSLTKPLTNVGEQELKISLGNPVFQNYTRLQEVHSSLIGFMELDEIDRYLAREKGTEGQYFQEPQNQRVALRALSFAIESAIKSPNYDETERMKYDDYQVFLNSVLDSMRRLDESIAGRGGSSVEGLQAIPNFVDQCVASVGVSVNRLRGVSNFRVRVDEIRQRIKDSIPNLANLNDGKLIKELHSILS